MVDLHLFAVLFGLHAGLSAVSVAPIYMVMRLVLVDMGVVPEV